MFYAVFAALLSENVSIPKRHRTVRSSFRQHFVRKGQFLRELCRDLVKSLELRQQSDYQLTTSVVTEDLPELVSKAEAFVTEVRSYWKLTLTLKNNDLRRFR